MDILLNKKRIRQLARNTLMQLNEKKHNELSALLVHNLCNYLKSHFGGPLKIATYAALPHEPDLSLLNLLLPEHEFYYPLISEPNLMDFHLVSYSSTLVTGFKGIAEPNPQVHPRILPQDLDLILAPGLSFDPEGGRIGQGGGYYDRFLSKIPTTPVIGITYSSQLVSKVPCEPHDHTMNYLASDRGIIPC